ncbi:MAG: hypothetical protein IPL27_20610 [Lewinellaceae bacterium]|nr:hypothetical protein [Lewinellaceae bacterium]
MTDNYTNIDELLAKRLAGEAAPEEEQQIEAWLRESADNRQYFEGLQRLWEQAPVSRAATLPAVDTERALQKVKMQLRSRRSHSTGAYDSHVPLGFGGCSDAGCRDSSRFLFP